MKLPVPFEWNGRTWTEAEIRRPPGGLLADTKKVADTGDFYSAILTFIAGALVSLTNDSGEVIEDRAQLKAAARMVPYLSTDYLTNQILILAGADDQIDQVVTCPRCHKKQPDPETLPRIRELSVIYSEARNDDQAAGAGLPVVPEISIALQYPVSIKDAKSGETIDLVEDLKMRAPNLDDCIRAYRKTGLADKARFQFAIYLEAITEVNGESVAAKWKAEIGGMIFDKMDTVDLRAIGEACQAWGIDNTLAYRCTACEKQFKVEADTSGFFASGLQG